MKIANLLIWSISLNYCYSFEKFMPFNSINSNAFIVNEKSNLITDTVQASYISEINDIDKFVDENNIDMISSNCEINYEQIKNLINPNEVDNFINIDIIQNKINEKLFLLNEDNLVNGLSINKKLGRFIVNSISSLLPKVDSIGHNVLHANNIFISDVLGSEFIPENLKRDIILASIKLAIYGDNAGSHLLELYYNIVDACL